MSVWCPKCQTLKNNKLKCDSCGFIEEDKSKSYKIPKPKQVRIINQAGLEKETITLNKNSIFIIATIIIAIGISYLAYNKYEENRQMAKVSKIIFGTDNPDELIDMMETQKHKNKIMLEQSTKQFNKAIEQSKRQLEKIKIPTYKPTKYTYKKPKWQIEQEKKKRRKLKNKKIQRQRILKERKERASAKEKLFNSMNN